MAPDGEVTSHSLERSEPTAGITVDGERARIGPLKAGRDLSPDDIESVDVVRFTAGQMGPDAVGVIVIRMDEPGSRAGRGTEIRISGRAAETAEGSVRARVQRDDRQTITLTRGEGEQATPQLQLRTREAITAALLQRHPEAATGGTGEYWLVADASGRVQQSGSSLRGGALNEIAPNRIEQMQVENIEIGGRMQKVIWIQLKG
jgi:hypothetical protein